MDTYKQIQNFVQEHHSVIIQTCWITRMKENVVYLEEKHLIEFLRIQE